MLFEVVERVYVISLLLQKRFKVVRTFHPRTGERRLVIRRLGQKEGGLYLPSDPAKLRMIAELLPVDMLTFAIAKDAFNPDIFSELSVRNRNGKPSFRILGCPLHHIQNPLFKRFGGPPSKPELN